MCWQRRAEHSSTAEALVHSYFFSLRCNEIRPGTALSVWSLNQSLWKSSFTITGR